jgi:hypothetical protein
MSFCSDEAVYASSPPTTATTSQINVIAEIVMRSLLSVLPTVRSDAPRWKWSMVVC